MSILERIVLTLFGGSRDDARADDPELIIDLAEMIVDVVEPRLRSCAGYRDKLEEGLRVTIEHLREMGRAPLDPIVLSRETWAIDPYVRAFFNSPDEVTNCISRSQDVRQVV